MRRLGSPLDTALLAAAWVCLACFLAFPILNPDVFWHLSAGRRILAEGAIPRADWLSWTRAGAPWVDFEWGSEALYRLFFKLGGLGGLFLLKSLPPLAALVVLHETLALYKVPRPGRVAGAALWTCAALPMADIRPEQFSLLAFAALFLLLERWRLAGKTLRWRQAGLFFALWANLHPGFVMGLGLLGVYWAADRLARLDRAAQPRAAAPPLGGALLAAAAGTFLQPHGLGLHRVIVEHALALVPLRGLLSEWEPPWLANPWFWPFWLILAAGIFPLLRRAPKAERLAWAPLVAWLGLAAAALSSGRFAVYFVAVGLPLTLRWAAEEKLVEKASWGLAACGCVLAAYMAWNGAALGSFSALSNGAFVPAAATEFLKGREADLGALRLYNEWTWGGYLGWRLYPRYQVFQDGRYLFHDLLQEEAAASRSAREWRKFLDRYGVQLAVVTPQTAGLMTTGPWSVVYSDGQATILKRRASADGRKKRIDRGQQD